MSETSCAISGFKPAIELTLRPGELCFQCSVRYANLLVGAVC